MIGLVSGCALKVIDVKNSDCLLFSPIYLSENDLKNLSAETKKELLTHNAIGEKVCGW